jgi:hypothetical protein
VAAPLALVLVGVGPGIGAGQTAGDGAYLDARAGTLHDAASRRWGELDASVVRYTAEVQQRIAAQLRTPLKDRTLYRNETAARVFWDRDHDPLIQVLGARTRYPGRDLARTEGDLDILEDLPFDGAFDPGGDRLLIGFNADDDDGDAFEPSDDDFWFAHPLAPGADTLYRFRSGDTTTLSFPDGRELRAVRLDVLPRVADVHRMTGSLWIEPSSGNLVRAVFRLSRRFDAIRDVPELAEEEEKGSFDYVPGLFKPWTFDLTLMAVDYTLWDFEIWLPRSVRFEGEVAAGVLRLPVKFDVAYRMESVVLESDLDALADRVPVTREVHFETRAEAMAFMAELASAAGDEVVPYSELVGDGRDRDGRYLLPADPTRLETNPALPPPIWRAAPGFADEDDLDEMVSILDGLPDPPVQGVPWTANWGLQRPDLWRYNRIEGPAVGGRLEAATSRWVGPVEWRAQGFFGLADLEPKVRLEAARHSLRRSWRWGAYREVQAVDPRGRFLGFGNSVNALFFGRDDGEYFLATGADMVITPAQAERESWRLRLYAERHHELTRKTRFALVPALGGDDAFRANLGAEPTEEAGAELTLRPWWGSDPLAPQFGVELYAQGAAARDPGAPSDRREYARARVVARAAVPLAGGRWRVGTEVAGGHAWGRLPLQRSWVVGGPLTLRGYPAGTRVGPTMGRVRLEVARVRGPAAWTLFGDGAWVGERDAWDPDDVLWAVGAGASVLDGLVRMDLSRGLTGELRRWRLDLYLDAIL